MSFKLFLNRGAHTPVDEMIPETPSPEHAMGDGATLQPPLGDSMESTMVPSYKVPIVIYHGNCADGFSAAWCFYNAQESMGQTFEFHAGVYNDPPPDVEDRHVFLVDFSYKRDVVKDMCHKARSVTLIDHHISAIEDLAPLNDTSSPHFCWNFMPYTDVERSGAMLAWDFLHNVMWMNEVQEPSGSSMVVLHHEAKPGDPDYVAPPMLLEHIQDRDLWRFRLAGTREIQAAVTSFEYTFENWNKLMGIGDRTGQIIDKLQLWKEGAAIERKHFKDINELLQLTKRMMRIDDWEVPIANMPYTMASDAGHILAKEFEDGTKFAATYYDSPTHRVFSLRSTERGMNVAEIATKYNGGGHKHAAGFRVPRTHMLAMI